MAAGVLDMSGELLSAFSAVEIVNSDFAPAWASAIEVAAPIPELPPVTSAVWPESRAGLFDGMA